MNKLRLLVALSSTAALALCLQACGGKSVLETTGGAGAGGSGGSTAACPSGAQDQDVMSLAGSTCATPGDVCASNNGCGGCSVTCTEGHWKATGSGLCTSIGSGC